MIKDDYKRFREAARNDYDTAVNMVKLEAENLRQKNELKIEKLGNVIAGLNHEQEELARELNAGEGSRPRMVLEANMNRGILYLVLTFVLWGAYFSINVWSFQPFEGFHGKGYIIAIGLVIVGSILIDIWLFYLRKCINENYFNMVLLFVALGGIASVTVVGLGLALMRSWFAETMFQVQTSTSAVIGDGVNATGQTYTATKFYNDSYSLLKIVFPVMTVSFEVCTGLTLFSSMDKLFSTRPLLKLHRRIDEIRSSLIAMADRIKHLGVEHEIFEREAINAIQEEVNKPQIEVGYTDPERRKAVYLVVGMVAFFMGLLLVFLMFSKAFANETELVAIDLSTSEMVEGYDGRTEFEKNLDAIDTVISTINPSTNFYVVGINAVSFGFPQVILKARTADKGGYFREIIKRQRNEILAAWQKKKAGLKADAQATDLLGTMRLAAMIFKNYGNGAKRLFIFSDMRHSKGAINLERMDRIRPSLIDELARDNQIYNLKGVDVYVYGVHAAGKTDAYWDGLKQLWGEYFRRAGAQLKAFSNMREVKRDEPKH